MLFHFNRHDIRDPGLAIHAGHDQLEGAAVVECHQAVGAGLRVCQRNFGSEAICGCGDQGGGVGVNANLIQQGIQTNTFVSLLTFLGVFGGDFNDFHGLEVGDGEGHFVCHRAGKAQGEVFAASGIANGITVG